MIASYLPINLRLRVSEAPARRIARSTTATTNSISNIAQQYSRRSAVCLFSASARMSKSGSSSSLSTTSFNAARNNINAKKQTLPAERQKTLNRFLGLPLEQRQTRVDSLFRKQVRESSLPVPGAVLASTSVRSITTSTSTAASESHEVMEIDASSDVEQVNSVSKANGKYLPTFFCFSSC